MEVDGAGIQKWTVVGDKSERSWRIKVDDPKDWKWTILRTEIGRSWNSKANGPHWYEVLKKWNVGGMKCLRTEILNIFLSWEIRFPGSEKQVFVYQRWAVKSMLSPIVKYK